MGLALDAAGVLLVGTPRGLFRLDDDVVEHVLPLPAGSAGEPPSFEHIALHTDGSIWLNSRSGVLYRYDPETGTTEDYRHQPGDTESIGAGEVFVTYVDHSGIAWVGTGLGGLNKVVRRTPRFAHFRHDPSDPRSLMHDYVGGIASSGDSVLWVGTEGGINRFDRRTRTSTAYPYDPLDPASLPGEYLYDVLETRDGALWVHTQGGLGRRAPGSSGFQPVKPSSTAVSVSRTLLEDREGNVWSAFAQPGDGAALYRAPPGSDRMVIAFHLPDVTRDGDGYPPIQAMAEGRDRTLWIGFWNAGLLAVDESGGLRNFTHEPGDPSSLSHDIVQSLYEDSHGRLWVGSRGGGLSLLDRATGRFRHFRTGDGLADNTVYGILEDDLGFLWISTNRGLSRLDPATETFRNFDVSYGLQSNEFNRWAFEKTEDGFLAFGGINGFNFFQPGRFAVNDVPPRVALTEIRVGAQTVANARSAPLVEVVRLAHDQNFITFEFVALHFGHPEKNRHRYRMDGLDGDWLSAGPRGSARYPDLRPGRYVFRVDAANADGVWSEGAVALPIVVLPPFWATWWFMLIASAAAAAALFAGHRYRTARLLHEERMRIRIARDLHDDVSATLSSISYFAEALQSGSAQEAERRRRWRYLHLIRQGASEARERISDIIWAIDPEHDSWPATLAKFRRHASDLLGGRDIEYDIVMPSTLPVRTLRAEERQHLWLIYKELLANIIRHADASRVVVRLMLRDDSVELSISDDGAGFDTTEAGRGHGVGNLQARAAGLGGSLDLETAPGRGTTWTLTFRP